MVVVGFFEAILMHKERTGTTEMQCVIPLKCLHRKSFASSNDDDVEL